jgi:regulator of sirC expression with transglutaminase-like and TPR domain
MSMPRHSLAFLVAMLLLTAPPLQADEKKEPVKSSGFAPRTVEQIAEQARKSVVMITFTGRDGRRQGLGTGFVVGDGLIATNMHVLGEGRPLSVQLADGKRHDVTSVHASDRALDLALVRIDAKGLTPLELADSTQIKVGQAVVALGNPKGLEYSVVGGVVSGQRVIDNRTMIQLAIPVEEGNSGGPILDLQGRVLGIVTMKSLVTRNLGFAMPVNALKPLLKKPNPIPMARWVTIGALDPREWKPLMGAHWRQRAGHIHVAGEGKGFGGRSLCLWQRPLPELPFEVAVTVRLDDEAGAAGLAWNADGGNKHYGFYPTGGKLRLTRFDGPDVYSWKILNDQKLPAYRPGEWNTLKVRVEKEKILCYVNDKLAFESTDTGLTSGRVGLAKFRTTQAEFKQFRVAREIPPSGLSADRIARVLRMIDKVPAKGELTPELIDSFLPDDKASTDVLRERALLLEKQAAQLRTLASAVHVRKVQAELKKALEAKEEKIDLLRAALLIARLDNAELDVDAYGKEVDRLAQDFKAALPKDAADRAKLAALGKLLFQERGFHGSRVAYYTRANSYLNEVLDDREGIPITLCVLYMELAQRLGVKVVGVGMPGHFIVKHVPDKGPEQLIDAYDGGKLLTRADASKIVEIITGEPLRDEDLNAVSKRAILVRMLQNLHGIARQEKDVAGALRYLDTILVISPESVRERWMRAVSRHEAGQRRGALEDTDWILRNKPEGIDLRLVRQFRQMLTRQE